MIFYDQNELSCTFEETTLINRQCFKLTIKMEITKKLQKLIIVTVNL